MHIPLRTSFLFALVVPALALSACADDSSSSSSSSTSTTAEAGRTADASASTTTTAAAGKGSGTFVVGDRTYSFDAKRCTAKKGNPIGTVLADGNGTFDGRPFTVAVKSSPGSTSAIETVQVVFAATESVVGTNFVTLPDDAAGTKLKVTEDGKATGTITVAGTGGQPSGDGLLTLTCEK
jgi:outer membrane lipoprotein-sorting protein